MAAITGITLCRNRDGRFELVATSQREGSRDTVWLAREITDDGIEWTNLQPFGRLDDGTSSPSACLRFAQGALEVVVNAGGRKIWRRSQTEPGEWSDWSSLKTPGGESFLGSLSLGLNDDGRLEVFVGRQDGTVWHRWQVSAGSNAKWSPRWKQFGLPDSGVARDPVVLGTNAAGKLVAFAPASETPGSDRALWYRWQLSTPGGGWSSWTPLGKPRDQGFDRVVVAQNADQRLEVFTVADDGQVWHRWQERADDPESWEQPWHSLGEPGKFSEVAVVLDANACLTLVAVSRDRRALWQRTQVRPSDGWNPNPWVKLATDLADPVEQPLLYLRGNGRLGVFLLLPETGGLHQRLQESGGLWPSKDWAAP